MTQDTLTVTTPPLPMQSEQVDQLVAALAKAQGEFGKVLRDSENPQFRSGYASLGATIEAVRPALAKNGLVVFQTTVRVEGEENLETMLAHESGQWKRSLTEVKVDPQGKRGLHQGYGSALTYLRRYQELAILNLAVEDDDGESAREVQRGQGGTQRANPPPPRSTPPPPGQPRQQGQGSHPPDRTPEQKKEAFVATCKTHAIRLGNDLYRRTLKAFDLEHARDVDPTDVEKMKSIVLTLASLGAPGKESAPDTGVVQEVEAVERELFDEDGIKEARIDALATQQLHAARPEDLEKYLSRLRDLLASKEEHAAA